MIPVARQGLLFPVYQTAATQTSQTALLPSVTPPGQAGLDGYLPCITGGGAGITGFKFMFYGAGANNNTGRYTIWGICPTAGNDQVSPAQQPLWVPFVLVAGTYTLCTTPGLSGCDVNASQLFADTITVTTGNANYSCEVISPTGEQVATLFVASKDAHFVYVNLDTNSSSTSCNALAQAI